MSWLGTIAEMGVRAASSFNPAGVRGAVVQFLVGVGAALEKG